MAWQPPKSFRDRPVVVLGGGVLGRRIAACWTAGGWNVHIRDPSQSQREEAVQYVQGNIGLYTTLTQRTPGRTTAFEDLATAVKNAWLVFEAVPEVLSIKTDTFRDLEKCAPLDCIFGSNSSSYKSSEMLTKVQPATKARILNTHYMMPPESRIVELMTDGHTEPGIFDFLIDRHREAGLHPIVALKESTGFVFNRVWAAIKRETLKVIQEGVTTPEAIDAVFMEMYGAKEGPCRKMDNVGLDTVSFIEQHYVQERDLDRTHLDWLDRNYVGRGKLGKKTPAMGGLYPVPEPGSQTVLIFLNLGVAEPLDDKLSMEDVMHRGQIMSLNIDTGGQVSREILGHESMLDGIDIHGDRMYWTDMGVPSNNDGAIFSAKLDGTDIRVVVPKGATHTPKQLVVAHFQRKLYWCDREGYRVMRCGFDGSGQEILVQTGDFRLGTRDQQNWCVGIAVSEKLGKIFWTQKGASKASQGRILSADIETPSDPSSRGDIEVIIDNLPECIDLELDDEEGILYWTDRGELPLGNTLNKKTLFGAPPVAEKKLGRQILAQGFSEAIGLKLDKKNDCLYVTDIGGHIWKCDPHRPALKQKLFESPTGAFTGISMIRV